MFGLRWAQKTNRVLWHLELFSARLPVKVFKTLNGWQSHILSKFHKIVLANLNYHMSIKTSQAILKGFIDLKSSVFQKQQTQLTRGDFFRRFSAGAVMTSNVACHAMLLTENSNERTRDQQKHYIEIPQNRLVWSGSRLMIVQNGWIFSICGIYSEYGTAGQLVFWKPWPAVELKKVLSVTKHGFVFWAQRKPNQDL